MEHGLRPVGTRSVTNRASAALCAWALLSASSLPQQQPLFVSWPEAFSKFAQSDSVEKMIVGRFMFPLEAYLYGNTCLMGAKSLLTDTTSMSNAGRGPTLHVLQNTLLKGQRCHPEEKALHVLPWKGSFSLCSCGPY